MTKPIKLNLQDAAYNSVKLFEHNLDAANPKHNEYGFGVWRCGHKFIRLQNSDCCLYRLFFSIFSKIGLIKTEKNDPAYINALKLETERVYKRLLDKDLSERDAKITELFGKLQETEKEAGEAKKLWDTERGQFTARIGGLDTTIKNLEAQKTKLTAEISGLINKNRAAIEAQEVAERLKDKKVEELKDLHVEVNTLKKKIPQLEQDISQRDQKILELSGNLTKVAKEVEEAKKLLDSEKTRMSLQTTEQAKSNTMALDNLKQRETQLTAEIRTLTNKNREAAGALEAAVQQKDKLADQLKDLQADVDALKKEIPKLQGDISQRDQKISELTGKIKELEREADKATKNLKSKSEEKDKFNREKESLTTDLNLLKEESRMLKLDQSELKDLKGKMATLKTENDQIKEKLQKAEREKQALLQEKAAWSTERQALEKKLKIKAAGEQEAISEETVRGESAIHTDA